MVWTPESHHLFPPAFQKAIYTYLCCHYKEIISNATDKMIDCKKSCNTDVKKPNQKERYNVKGRNHLATLPTSVALHVISFMSQEWFQVSLRREGF